jgi:hypothetical protein
MQSDATRAPAVKASCRLPIEGLHRARSRVEEPFAMAAASVRIAMTSHFCDSGAAAPRWDYGG